MDQTDFLFQQLLDVNVSAFDQESFTVAYHALAGAMHCAYRLRDGAKLAEVEQLANTQWEHLKACDVAEPDPLWSEPTQATLVALYRSLAKLARSRYSLV